MNYVVIDDAGETTDQTVSRLGGIAEARRVASGWRSRQQEEVDEERRRVWRWMADYLEALADQDERRLREEESVTNGNS